MICRITRVMRSQKDNGIYWLPAAPIRVKGLLFSALVINISNETWPPLVNSGTRLH